MAHPTSVCRLLRISGSGSGLGLDIFCDTDFLQFITCQIDQSIHNNASKSGYSTSFNAVSNSARTLFTRVNGS